MKRKPVRRHPDLFEEGDPLIVVPGDQKEQLVRLILSMLIEIVAAKPALREEVGDDKDHA